MKNDRFFIRFYACLFLSVLFAVCIFAFLPSGGFSSAVAEELDASAVGVLEKCCDYADSHPFSTSAYGEVTARVFGIKYLQTIYGDRHVNGGEYSERAESVSSFVKAAIKKSRSGGRYFVSHGAFKRGKAVYPDRKELTESDYLASYGAPPLGLLKYELDGNILSAKKVGDNEYVYTLDPVKSTVNCAIGVKTMLGGSLPKYRSVEVVLYTDGAKPIKTVCRERLFVDKFGGVECSATYEETFRF